MGELIDYYLIESVIEYTDDPLKIGRVRATIPGVIHHSTTVEKEALPWIRPFKMYCYQTFTKPLPGQKIWVLVNKTNYNEFWWFPYSEIIDIVKGYLEEYYDETPDVFHAREEFVTPIMHTWDNKQGYKWVIGEDYIDFFPTREFKLKVHDCDIKVENNKVYAGGENSGDWEPAIKGNKMCELLGELKKMCTAVQESADGSPYTKHLKPSLEDFANTFTKMNNIIVCKKLFVN